MSRLRVSGETGSVVLGIGLVGVLLMFVLGVGLVGAATASYATAATAADAAALAAAPVTFRPFGASGGPTSEARRLAEVNGARLVTCVCPIDRSWASRTVTVSVATSIRLPIVGRLSISATSRASFDPQLLLVAGGGG